MQTKVNYPEYKTYTTPSATFLIPVNAAGESISQEEIEFEAGQEEAEKAYEWIMHEAELQRMDEEKNFGHNHIF